MWTPVPLFSPVLNHGSYLQLLHRSTDSTSQDSSTDSNLSTPPATAQVFSVIAAAFGTIGLAFCIRFTWQRRRTLAHAFLSILCGKRQRASQVIQAAKKPIFVTLSSSDDLTPPNTSVHRTAPSMETSIPMAQLDSAILPPPIAVPSRTTPMSVVFTDSEDSSLRPRSSRSSTPSLFRGSPTVRLSVIDYDDPDREGAGPTLPPPAVTRASFSSSDDQSITPRQSFAFLKYDPSRTPLPFAPPSSRRLPSRAGTSASASTAKPVHVPRRSRDGGFRIAGGYPGESADTEEELDYVWRGESDNASVETQPPRYRSGSARRGGTRRARTSNESEDSTDRMTVAGMSVDRHSLRTLPPEYEHFGVAQDVEAF